MNIYMITGLMRKSGITEAESTRWLTGTCFWRALLHKFDKENAIVWVFSQA